ncbi:MAG: O-acetyl-ADP-ribose deacetylase [Candidatus Sericytochromatia bacterium]
MKTEKLEIIIADITTLKVDVIVNAANNSLLGVGGVDGAIHKVAGYQLLAECKKLNGCNTGEAKLTKGYNLPAKYVIHTVGPIWRGGFNNESLLLSKCYKNSLKIVQEHNFKTIAFPSISTGVYRYPLEEATKIALSEISQFLDNNELVEKIIICCFDQNTFDNYLKSYESINS